MLLKLPRSLPALPSHTSSFLVQIATPQTLWSISDSLYPQVFSSAKYPAPERLQEYGSIFTGAQDPGLQRRPRHRIQSKHRPLDEWALQVWGAHTLQGVIRGGPGCWGGTEGSVPRED